MKPYSNLRSAEPTDQSCDPRWHALNLVQKSREILGLRDRDITVLRGLLTLITAKDWLSGKTIFVYASNITLRERCDGIEERTLRRRLVALQQAGLITRHMSPNRKRYVLRDAAGDIVLHYGFDLSPLRAALERLTQMAKDAEEEQQAIKYLRKLIRDRLWHLEQAGSPSCPQIYALLRNKVTSSILKSVLQSLPQQDRVNIENTVDNTDKRLNHTNKMTDSDGQNVRDIQKSNKEKYEENEDKLTIQDCYTLAPDAMAYAPNKINTWNDIGKLTDLLGPALAITDKQMESALLSMGYFGRSIAILGLVQAGEHIKAPARYFATLAKKAMANKLDIKAMFYSLTKVKRHFIV